MLSALGILPCEIFKIGVSEIQFPMLAGLELVNQEGLQARNQGGVHGVHSHPPTGPKGPHFDTQYPS